MPQHKYARLERERRFLLHQFPHDANVVHTRRITDSYIESTTLRLREQTEDGRDTVFKLTQKIPLPARGSQQGFVTTIYLTQDEFRVLAQLPSKKLQKLRYSVPPFGIDIFEGALQGLILAEAEFDSEDAAAVFPVPSFAAAEVTTDARFTGGRLVQSTRHELKLWLSEYGIAIV